MFNLLDKIKENPVYYNQLSVDDQLMTKYNCPLETDRETVWTQESYFVYVLEGKKIWHIPGQAFELTAGKCIFVKKGAHIVEQFFDTSFCLVLFFLSDQFIIDTMRTLPQINTKLPESKFDSVILHVETDDTLHAFFNSVIPYFLNHGKSNTALLELKFKELILNVVHNPANNHIAAYFNSLLLDTSSDNIRRIMEENFYYNLGLDEFARLSGCSLSVFKRKFAEIFKTTPGKWLLERRLQHARVLIHTTKKTLSEIAFECGFENASHFSRAFKTQFGNAPAHYREGVEL